MFVTFNTPSLDISTLGAFSSRTLPFTDQVMVAFGEPKSMLGLRTRVLPRDIWTSPPSIVTWGGRAVWKSKCYSDNVFWYNILLADSLSTLTATLHISMVKSGFSAWHTYIPALSAVTAEKIKSVLFTSQLHSFFNVAPLIWTPFLNQVMANWLCAQTMVTPLPSEIVRFSGGSWVKPRWKRQMLRLWLLVSGNSYLFGTF